MKLLTWFTALLIAGSAAAAAAPNTPNAREWNRLVAEYDQIVIMRGQLPQPPESAPRKEQIEIVLANHKRLEPIYGTFLDRLRDYYERTGDMRAAQVYAAEKIRIGDEYARVLARYDRAIVMYQSALALDPANPQAQEKLRQAQERRFVSMDRFAQVRNGMSEAQVRQILGEPQEPWKNQRVHKNRVYSVWIYPKSDGSASAVYFDDGTVYHTSWNAAAAGQAGN
jgi:tetratricopeptide (TPR) repeat protein